MSLRGGGKSRSPRGCGGSRAAPLLGGTRQRPPRPTSGLARHQSPRGDAGKAQVAATVAGTLLPTQGLERGHPCLWLHVCTHVHAHTRSSQSPGGLRAPGQEGTGRGHQGAAVGVRHPQCPRPGAQEPCVNQGQKTSKEAPLAAHTTPDTHPHRQQALGALGTEVPPSAAPRSPAPWYQGRGAAPSAGGPLLPLTWGREPPESRPSGQLLRSPRPVPARGGGFPVRVQSPAGKGPARGGQGCAPRPKGSRPLPPTVPLPPTARGLPSRVSSCRFCTEHPSRHFLLLAPGVSPPLSNLQACGSSWTEEKQSQPRPRHGLTMRNRKPLAEQRSRTKGHSPPCGARSGLGRPGGAWGGLGPGTPTPTSTSLQAPTRWQRLWGHGPVEASLSLRCCRRDSDPQITHPHGSSDILK